MRVALVVNPVAGVGGPAGLKGSDGGDVQARARAAGYHSEAVSRTIDALRSAEPVLHRCRWLTVEGDMGGVCLDAVGVRPEQVMHLGAAGVLTTGADTTAAVRQFQRWGVDLVLFAGGDGTARDVAAGLAPEMLVLGIPAGAKMYSGVFVTSPPVLGAVLTRLLDGGLVRSRRAEVVDVDEAGLRQGRLGTRFYAEFDVPDLGAYVQHTKIGGREDEALVLVEIAADVEQRIGAHDGPVVLGPGSTLMAVKEAIIGAGTLLGVDVIDVNGHANFDVDAKALAALAPAAQTLLVTSFLRGQGFLFGRGNRQLSAAWLSALPASGLCVVASRSKLATLDGRPLLVDTGDGELDERLCGVVRITAGFEDDLLYRVARHG